MEDMKKEILTSSWIAANSVNSSKTKLVISGKLWKTHSPVMSPIKSIGSRAFQLSVGRHPQVSQTVKNVLRKKLITNAKETNADFEREIIFSKNYLEVIDTVSSSDKIKDIFLGEKYSNIFIPSSRYFHLGELNNKVLHFSSLNSESSTVSRKYFKSGKVSYKLSKNSG